MLLADPQPPLMEEVPLERVHGGEVVTVPLWVAYSPPYYTIPASLTLSIGWDGCSWAQTDRYRMEVLPKEGPVVRVRLHRDERKLLNLPPGGDRSPFYEVSVVGDGGWCACRGFTLNNEERHPCKHVAGVARIADVLTEDSHEQERVGGEAEPGATGPGRQED